MKCLKSGPLIDFTWIQIRKRTCEAYPAGENSLFILTAGVKSVPLYHFKLPYAVLHMDVKEFFETNFLKWRNRPF